MKPYHVHVWNALRTLTKTKDDKFEKDSIKPPSGPAMTLVDHGGASAIMSEIQCSSWTSSGGKYPDDPCNSAVFNQSCDQPFRKSTTYKNIVSGTLTTPVQTATVSVSISNSDRLGPVLISQTEFRKGETYTMEWKNPVSGSPDGRFTFCSLDGELNPGPISITFILQVDGVLPGKYNFLIQAVDQDNVQMLNFSIITNPE